MDFLENASKSWNQSSHFLLFKKKQKQIQQVLNFSKMALCIAKHQVVGIFGRQHSHIT